MKILFLVSHSNSPSTEYRVLNYLPYFKKKGIKCTVDSFIFPEFYKILYKKKNFLKKFLFLILAYFRIIKNLFRSFHYDLIFIQREFSIIGCGWFERILSKFKPTIYDFDDALFIPQKKNVLKKIIKCPRKIKKIISSSSHVIAGNEFLANYAQNYNKNTTIIPTVIDLKKYPFQEKTNHEKIILGWMGSHATLPYIKKILPLLKPLTKKYNLKIKIVASNIHPIKIKGLNIEWKEWKKEEEIKDLHSFDIGLMPTPATLWAKGKCGFKGVQYMAAGIPVIASAVGFNKKLIKDGIDGFLVNKEEEWLEKITLLIENKILRKKISCKARKKIEKEYSIQKNISKYINIFKQAYHRKKYD